MSAAFENIFADKSDTSIAKLSIQNYFDPGADGTRGFPDELRKKRTNVIKLN